MGFIETLPDRVYSELEEVCVLGLDESYDDLEDFMEDMYLYLIGCETEDD